MNEDSAGATPARDQWQEAVEWYEHFQSQQDTPPKPQAIREWQDWVALEKNRSAYDAYCRLVANRTRYARRDVPKPDELRHDLYDPSAPLIRPGHSEWPADRAARGKSRSHRWTRTFAIAAGVVFLTIGATLALRRFPNFQTTLREPARFHETAAGELRHIALPDGSHIALGAQSAIALTFTAQRRSITLVRGEALFQVSHDPARPFVVGAGPNTITALGTGFVVERDSDRVVVTVTAGTVSVNASTSGLLGVPVLSRQPRASTHLSRGQRIILEDSGGMAPVEHTDADAAAGWDQGRLAFDHQPLRYVVQKVNRYSHIHIRVDDFTGAQIYTGFVLQDEIEDWVHALPRAFAIEVREDAGGVCLYAREHRNSGTASCPGAP